ncbi:hypothetical protein [Microbacterium resistens]|uniref:hypothetical protein n=1 Tax=Microbacterium resistens TaxID=156977 RepID=UPI0008333644|nr:hypothetical protein [Microbacterium resistens]
MHTPPRFGAPAGIAVVVAAAVILSGPASAHAQEDVPTGAGGTVTLTGNGVSIQTREAPEPILDDPAPPTPIPLPAAPAVERPEAALPPGFVPERPTPSAPEPEDPATPDPEAPATPFPELPAQPDPEAPAPPGPELPAQPDPETPAGPDPETPASPDPELPAQPDPEAPAIPDLETPATPDPEDPRPEAPAAPIPPATPDGLVAHADPDGAVALAWDDAGEGTEYRVERSVDGGLPELLGDTLLPRFRDETVLIPGVYVYRVSAIDADGEPSGGFAEVSLRIEDAGEAPVSSPGATTEIGARSDVRTTPVRERGEYRD